MVLFWICENLLDLKVVALVALVLLWGLHLARIVKRDPQSWARWGLRPSDRAAAWRNAGLVLGIGLLALATYRVVQGWRGLPTSSIWIFLGYPVWSAIQQFVLQGILVADLETLGARRGWLLTIAPLAFGAAHLPDFELAALCALAGLPWTWLFLRDRAILPLALVHSVLGTLAFYWVLERNPLQEFGYA